MAQAKGKRREEQKTNFVVGLFVIAFGGLLLASLFIIAISEGVLTEKTTIRAHFRTVSGLTKSSKVQLAGEDAERMQKIIDLLEDLDDVQEVFTTAVLDETE